MRTNSLSRSGRGLVIPGIARPTEADVALATLSRTDGTNGGLARRRFLQGALAMGGVAGLTAFPSVFPNVAPGLFGGVAGSAAPLGPGQNILVTVMLSGGNDHLNTLIPAENGAYQSARGGLAVSVDGSTSVGEGLHLHPNLAGLKSRFDAGQVAFIRGVGESTDDHSHFTSMATWMSGNQNQVQSTTGWLGRYQDGAGLDSLGSVAIGWSGVPLTLQGVNSKAVSLSTSGSLFGADRAEPWERYGYEAISDIGSAGGGIGAFGAQIAGTWGRAIDTAQQISPAFVPELPEDGLARELAVAAQVINLNLGTQLVNVTLDGFDSHDNQRPEHDNLLAELDAGIDAFFAQLSPAMAVRTSLLIFSEFGRRVERNSTGTDHGTTGLMTLIGPAVKGGLHGTQPSLTNLDERGDMHHHLDFRSVYATILEDWLEADSAEVLGANYPTLDLYDSDSSRMFNDVPRGAYYAPAVGWLAASGITSGTGPGAFSPDDNVTRAQMAAFLWRYRGEPAGAPNAGFSDVPAGLYYTKAVDWLYAQRITMGVGGNRYGPNDNVTRAQMAAFLWRLEGSAEGSPPSGFSDVPAGYYYTKAVDWLYAQRITMGVGGNRYGPSDNVTRGQMATFLWRLAGTP
ncbi:MAG: S-layer homology domain-containing protein [Acidimicrobiales bacterium]|nr:S-layer homology domain-containing protein [Acidimicrobiales bacterium]